MNPELPELTVSIINYRTAALTIQSAQSVLDDMQGIDGHIVIVDNASGDGSAEEIAAWIQGLGPSAHVTLVRAATNAGFAAGHNRGIATRPAQHYLILNSDAVLRPGCLSALLETACKHPDAGLITPRLEDPDTTTQISHFRFFTPQSEMIRAAGTAPITRLLSRYDVPLAPSPVPNQIGWASFACILLRHDMVSTLGPMDEGYFLYFEDCAYCLRARRHGWRIANAPGARAVHLRGGSAPVKQLAAAHHRLPAYYYASRTRFLYQAHGRLGLLAANLAWHVGRAIARARVLWGRPVPQTVMSEARDIWTNFSDPLGNPLAPRD